MQALVDEETVVKMMNYAYNLRDPRMEAEFLHSQVYVMQVEHCVCHLVMALPGVYIAGRG
jgi:hypothetical protein